MQNVQDAEKTLGEFGEKGTVLEAVESLHIPVTLSKKIEVSAAAPNNSDVELEHVRDGKTVYTRISENHGHVV